ncbi:hypothetical protein EMIHUDRAFT_440644 [Emiliania huxleyi CCMP1516]|uniref:Uncharacterized protein n=2 Tax=Emiliania huxleyi TaxID=2903 RepID=A0A0D3KKJ9_EMIH1|nr:hypothetical protein EMIHUDRAFT_440644 [Emiliania huxleyi CCMP1516]EOD36284.1 hypothetical protein EMIHUDRAFT_440644 [Emiliania huxleyi CCMP1516]|eukprot:XP_005788713.1 hypothetical protein EMIHUDRAFT_440644 [Emiliania huxleyi CCMP1516]
MSQASDQRPPRTPRSMPHLGRIHWPDIGHAGDLCKGHGGFRREHVRRRSTGREEDSSPACGQPPFSVPADSGWSAVPSAAPANASAATTAARQRRFQVAPRDAELVNRQGSLVSRAPGIPPLETQRRHFRMAPSRPPGAVAASRVSSQGSCEARSPSRPPLLISSEQLPPKAAGKPQGLFRRRACEQAAAASPARLCPRRRRPARDTVPPLTASRP